MSKDELLEILYQLPDDVDIYFNATPSNAKNKGFRFVPVDCIEMMDVNYDSGTKQKIAVLSTFVTMQQNESFIYNLTTN